MTYTEQDMRDFIDGKPGSSPPPGVTVISPLQAQAHELAETMFKNGRTFSEIAEVFEAEAAALRRVLSTR